MNPTRVHIGTVGVHHEDLKVGENLGAEGDASVPGALVFSTLFVNFAARTLILAAGTVERDAVSPLITPAASGTHDHARQHCYSPLHPPSLPKEHRTIRPA
jgi:hypothetical protein